MLGIAEGPFVSEMTTKENRQAVRTALSKHLKRGMNHRFDQISDSFLMDMRVSLCYINAGSHLQLVLRGFTSGKMHCLGKNHLTAIVNLEI